MGNGSNSPGRVSEGRHRRWYSGRRRTDLDHTFWHTLCCRGFLSVEPCFKSLARLCLPKPPTLQIICLSVCIGWRGGCPSPFQMRRRGVELKMHLGEALSEIDQTLVSNIINAQRWMNMILDGKTFSEIALAEGTSKRRIQDVVDLAMLAPDILDAIAAGEQPDGLTSDYLIKTGVPALWAEQREAFAKL